MKELNTFLITSLYFTHFLMVLSILYFLNLLSILYCWLKRSSIFILRVFEQWVLDLVRMQEKSL